MATTTSNGHARAIDDSPPVEARPVRRIPRAVIPDDAVPRLVGLGVPANEAQQLADQHDEQRIIDALDALEELGATSRIIQPAGWLRAAVGHAWDLTGVLAERRDREHRLAALHADSREREHARASYPAWRVISDRWDQAISSALDDDQLRRALTRVSHPLPGIGRHSIPVARAELISWAVDVHSRRPDVPLVKALADDLDRGVGPTEPPRWPLPEPPVLSEDSPGSPPLAERIPEAHRHDVAQSRDAAEVIEVAVPHRTVRFGQDLER